MTLSAAALWTVIGVLSVGTFLLRFSFLALIGKRQLPERVLRVLRYTPVAVIPGLMAPQIFLPAMGETTPDPVKLAAAAATLIVGLWTRNVIGAMATGIAVLALMTWLLP